LKFSDFRQYRPNPGHNVFVFVCEDEFLVQESRAVWAKLFEGNWQFEKMQVKEFEEVDAQRLMDDALTPSLFSQNRAILVTSADKVTKGRVEDLIALHQVSNSTLKIILATASAKAAEAWSRTFPVIQIDPLKPAEVGRWLMDRYGVTAETARYIVEAVGTELFALNSEMEKLRTYAGEGRAIEIRDVDALVLRSERFTPFELDDAILNRDYKKSVQVVGAMLDDGMEPLIVLSRIVRVWRQLFIGKGLAGKQSAKDVAFAAMIPSWKSGEFINGCKKYQWKQLAQGFRELLRADRAFKTSSPNVEAYFDVMLWKIVGGL
jgi:DNA polymerase-3 subunit delta